MNLAQVIVAALLWGIAGSALIALACTLLVRLRPLRAGSRRTLWFSAVVLMGLLPLAAVAASFARTTHVAVPGALPAPAATHNRSASTAKPAAHERKVILKEQTAASPSSVDADALRIALLVAGAGALAGIGSLLYSLSRLRAIKRRSSPLDESLSRELPWLAETIEGRETYLRLSYEIETPIAIGFGRPVILIPTDLATENGLTAIESLVIHEHAHLKQYDDYTNLVQRVIERLYWFNPFVWYAGRQLALAREMSADDAVLERGEDKAHYAQTLWRLAREMRMPSQPIVAPGALFTRKQISARIEAILSANRGQFTPLDPTAVFVGITLAFVAYGFVIWLTPAYRVPSLPATALGIWPDGMPDMNVTLPAPPEIAAPQAPAEAHSAAAAVARSAATVAAAAAAIASTGSAIAASTAGEGRRSVVISCTNGCDLDGHDFRGDDVHDMSFSGSSMDKADFSGARLRNIGFEGTSLDGAKFDRAELDGARFSGASIDGASFIGAKFSHVSFHGVDLSSAHFDNEGLRSILASGCEGCDLSGLDMRGIDLSGLTINGANMSDVDLRGANLRGAHFSGVQLDDAKLDDADLTDAKLTGCSLSGTSTTNAKLDRITLVGSSFN